MKRKKRRGQAQTAAHTETDRTYDKTAKAVLGNRQMLAPIVQRVVPEFRDISLEEIQDHCIDGELQISTVSVAPGKTNRKLSEMCSLSQGLKEWAKEEEQENTILRLLKNGKGIDIMVAATGWTIERVKSFLKSQNIQMAQQNI